MAGGIGSIKQGGKFDRPSACHYRYHLRNCALPKVPQNDTFQRRNKLEFDHTYLQNINRLQQDIFRIYTESIHCDLKIVNGCNVIKAHGCIVQTRCPLFYHALKPHFAYNNRTATCCVNVVSIFHQIENFVRLVYSNLDLTEEEGILVKIISSIPHQVFGEATKIYPDDLSCNTYRSKRKCLADSSDESSFEESIINQNVVNSRLSLSLDMADSGLETGSASPQESTVSENSGVDYEESQEDSNKLSTARSSRQLCAEPDIQEGGRVELQKLKGLLESTSDYNSSDVYADATCSSSETEQQHLDSSSSYEDNLHRARANKEREDEISRYENQVLKDPFYESDSSSESEHATPFVQTTQSFEYVGLSPKPDGNLSSEGSTKPASSYYFIDASSLNDDDIVANSSKQNFVPMNNDAVRDNVVEFQPNLRLTEHLEPPVEPRKVKRVFVDERVAVEKETLVVEIKETDSGENTQQTSPCPESMQGVIDNNAASNSGAHPPDNVVRIPPLVRGNTFELDSTDQEKISFLRQERERRQGTLVFQNSIQQYSGHRLDGNVFVPMDKYDFDTVEKETEPEKVSRCFTQSLTRSASHENVTDFEKESEECSMSLPVNLTHDPVNSQRPKFDKRWEAVPIVSGGARSEDFIQPKETMSPLSRRKTETTPIISGGSVVINDESNSKPKSRMSTSMAAWVVDMSDCNKPRPSNGTMSHSYSSSDCTRKTSSQKATKSSGFFVSFTSMESSSEQKSQLFKQESTKLKEQAATKSCEFYIDMSEKMERKKPRDKTLSDDKKNMFSMFIDLSESPKSTDKSAKSGESSATEENSERDVGQRKSSGVFMFIESDSPVVRRRTLSSSRPPFKRHSWNTDKMNNATASTTSNGPPSVGKEILYRKEHKRAQSLSVDRIELRKFQAKPSSSSHSLSESIRAEEKSHLKDGVAMDTSTEDVFEFENRDTPPNSHIEVLDEELRASAQQRREFSTQVQIESQGSESSVNWDKTANTVSTEEGPHRKSETFDISSGSDNNDFELPEMQLNGGESKSEHGDRQADEPVSGRILETRKSLDEKIKEIECVLKEPESKEEEKEKEPSSFVRLSDLDKTPSQTSSVLEEDKPVARMSSSIPETSWIESKLAVGRSNVPVRCVPRKQTMSTSLPAKRSPLDDLVADGESENMVSESDLSSLQSSMGRSGAEGSTEETETSSFAGMKPYNRLGEDLLRMFLEEINPDVTIDVAGRRIRAHKCILSSRCQYFAAILSGGWIESEGNVISLQGYSYNAVHFALCHIYSGESNIPETISIVELATLADMLCLEGLKEVIGYTLKVKYCHLFHKPCQICAVGVLECMPLAAAYGLDEVYRKSLRWVTRHFVRIWPCKAFATLPRELMEKCYHQHIVHMSTENVLQTMMDCDKLIATLPNVRWAEPIFRLVSNLLDASMKFLSDNMSGVLVSDSFQNLGRDLTWNISRLEDNFLAAAERLPPEQACKTYSKLHKIIASSQTEDAQQRPKWGSLFLDFLRKIQSRVEKCLVRDATRAARTNAWSKMDLDLRRHIQELACLVILPNEIVKRPSRRTNFLKEPRIPPPPQKNTTANRNLDLRRVKMAISEHNDRTQKQTLLNGTNNVQPKKVLVKPKTDPMERKNLNLHDDKSGSDSNTSRPKSWPNKVEVKSRYLEPRHKSVPKNAAVKQTQEKSVVQQQRRKIMISSSDSSRTSSPAMKRASERKALAKPKISVQKTTKALSSDSLAESNANKINNAKKTPTTMLSKSLGITRPESPSLKAKEIDIGYSTDSLVEPKSPRKAPLKKQQQQPNKMEISMSEDSLATEMAATPRSTVSSKISPTLNRTATHTPPVVKKSPPVQHKSPLSVTKRPQRSLECSTAASRSRAAAISSTYHPTPSLRRSLLDAAKTPDVGTIRQQHRTMTRQPAIKTKDTKREAVSNQSSQESPSKRSPKSNGSTRIIARSQNQKSKEEKPKVKQNGELPRHLTVGSRSGTFLKDEPTILKKSDLKTAQIDS